VDESNMKLIFRSMAVALGLALALAGATAQGQPLVIKNSAVEVNFDPASGRFSAASEPSHRPFIRQGSLGTNQGTARIRTVRDKVFGRGQSIVVTHSDGNQETILLFPKLPFVLCQASLRNGGGAAETLNKVPAFSGILEPGGAVSDLKTLGTGGLLAPDKNPGSYVWLAVADPQSRRGVVAGWITHDRGSGVVFSGVRDGEVTLDARIDYGRLRLAPGETAELETFAIGWFDDARLGLEQWADTVAARYNIHLRPQPAGYCTWYSRPYGGASDEKHLAELSVFAARELRPFGFSVVQIDDHWQAGISTNGPNRNFTTNAANGPYPGGMKAAADNIKALGLTPGLWFMPFAGTYYDPLFQGHPEWFVKRENGGPYETAWGGTCLDMTQPGAREFLRSNVRRIAGEWGYQYFKMDGLWTGTGTKQIYVNTGYKEDGMGDSVFHDPSKTGIEAYRSGLRLAREAAGKDVFILGCCTPQNMRSYGGAMGLVDAMRIGPDNGSAWDALLRGPTFGSRQYFLHGRVWYNDPDPVYVRAGMPLNHARLVASWVALTGQLNLSSEWLPDLPVERLDILKRTMPAHGLKPRPVDLFEAPVPRVWLLTDTRRSTRRDVVGLFNWDGSEKTLEYSLARIGLPADASGNEPAYEAYDFWGDKLLPLVEGNLRLAVPAESCVILALRPRADHPQLLSTSRHVTQGVVDVLDERWNAAKDILQGRSKLVAGDPYELRIVARSSAEHWTAGAVELSAKDKAAGVKAALKQEGELIRIRLESPESREVDWAVRFKKGI
jgi:hypothetical protein